MDLPRLRHVWRRVFLAYGWMALFVVAGFQHFRWVGRAAEMMVKRGRGTAVAATTGDPSTTRDPSVDGSAGDSSIDETGDPTTE